MKRVFIIHGWKGHPGTGWKVWLKQKLERKGFAVTIPSMPDSAIIKADNWIKKIIESVGEPDSETYFIGHSLGCAAILRYLETIDSKIGGCVLVSGPSDDMKFPPIRLFFTKPFNFAKIKSNCPKFVVFHSDNDKIVGINHGRTLAAKLGAELIITSRGHFTSMEGVKDAPEILEALMKLTDH